MNAPKRLEEVLTEIKQRRGTLYASPESLVLDPEVENVRLVAQRYVHTEDWNRIFNQVKNDR